MSETMLIVDDNEIDRASLTLMFENKFDILTANSGEQALEILLACNGNVDVMLLDLIMPGMSGLEVLRRRQSNEFMRQIPVVVITASQQTRDLVKVFSLGGNDFISKPFITDIVVSRVNNVIRAARRLQTLYEESYDLRRKAETDLLTGLLNKITTEQKTQAVLDAFPHNQHALIILDIDNFKIVNDEGGHLAGDQTLRIMADLLAGQFRKSDLVGRIGGDEFMVMMSNVPNQDIVDQKVDALVQLLRFKPNITLPANVTISIGYTLTQHQTMDFKTLYGQADEALNKAKKLGKARACQYGQSVARVGEVDDRSILIVGRNRSINTVLHSLWIGHRIEIVDSVRDLTQLPEGAFKTVYRLYLDISDGLTDYVFVRQLLASRSYMSKLPLVVLCEEGNLDQYREAMRFNLQDLLTVPLDIESLRRRQVQNMELGFPRGGGGVIRRRIDALVRLTA